MIKIKVKRVHPEAKLPKRATPRSACYDLYTCEDIILVQGNTVKARTGLVFEIPIGFYVQILPRSGFAADGILVPNSPGIIDSDYRGEVKVLLFTSIAKFKLIRKGTRIAQCVICRSLPYKFTWVDEVSDTVRGEGGFGSTGNT